MELIVFFVLGFVTGWGGTIIVLEKRKGNKERLNSYKGRGWYDSKDPTDESYVQKREWWDK